MWAARAVCSQHGPACVWHRVSRECRLCGLYRVVLCSVCVGVHAQCIVCVLNIYTLSTVCATCHLCVYTQVCTPAPHVWEAHCFLDSLRAAPLRPPPNLAVSVPTALQFLVSVSIS